MPIIYAWPTGVLPSRFRLRMTGNTQSGGRSPFDGTEQTLEQPGSRWAAELSFEGLPAEEHRPLLAFLASLRGKAGRFFWSPPFPRQGTGGGSPLIRVANQTGRKLQTKGWTASAANCVVLGDFLCFADPSGRYTLHQVTGDVNDAPNNSAANASGQCDFHISPPIRRSPAVDAQIIVNNAFGVFRLTEESAGLDFTRGIMAGGSISIEETIW